MNLPSDSKSRKEIPITTGFLDYFPLACAAVARVSYHGNQKHNPGQPLHWDRSKSVDHIDCAGRHILDRDSIDPDSGETELAHGAWRIMAALQEQQEKLRAKRPPGYTGKVTNEEYEFMTNKVNAYQGDPNGGNIENGDFRTIPLDLVPPLNDTQRGNDNCRDGRSIAEQKAGVPAGTIPPVGNPIAVLIVSPDGTLQAVIEHFPISPIVQPPTLAELTEAFVSTFDSSGDFEYESNPAVQQRRLDAEFLVNIGCPEEVAQQITGGTTYCEEQQNGTPCPYVYVAGPMRGYEQFNFPAFDRTRDQLLQKGYNVISPADIDRASNDNAEDTTQDVSDQTTFARRDFYSLLFIKKMDQLLNDLPGKNQPGAIALIPGWEKSTGAAAEFCIARWLGLKPLSANGNPLRVVNHSDLSKALSTWLTNNLK